MKNMEKFNFEIGDKIIGKDGEIHTIIDREIKSGIIGMYRMEDENGSTFWQAGHLTEESNRKVEV